MAPYLTKLAALAAAISFAFADHETYYNPKIRNPDASDQHYYTERWIVVYWRDNVTSQMADNHYQEVESNYAERSSMRRSFGLDDHRGFSLTTDVATINEIAQSNMVRYVERSSIKKTTAIVTQNNAPYGLARISRREPPTANTQYFYDETAGEGTTVYVMDTGVKIDHPEFENRASYGPNFIDGQPDTDENGHGTHVAGTVASRTWGVAKKARVISLKIFGKDGTGGGDGIIDALNYILDEARRLGPEKIVVNFSGGGAYNEAAETAWRKVHNASITVAVAAGNDGVDFATLGTNDGWPGQITDLITVASIDINNRRAQSSNYGTAVDIWAPGELITSLGIAPGNSTNVLSGTSMASPHIAGLAAYLISKEKLSGAENVANRIRQLATPNQVTDAGANTPNFIGFNGVNFDPTTTTTSTRTATSTSRATTTTTSRATSFTTVPTPSPYKPAPTPYKPKGKKPIGGHVRL
ncbi:hypothetical protein HYFRA_00008177 [Hymenoscyphus fraxineus]|uniref:Peptidase S8/S53 domain-containing protein n=1 Tax=Hymenoscyphus fraxineus TaxID=746836 RepID=A0A9N9PYX3_9HELO|nr:hypothetical protein HYFRA_00008177 [Hymenoscyphus fraxineus]